MLIRASLSRVRDSMKTAPLPKFGHEPINVRHGTRFVEELNRLGNDVPEVAP